jgi:hypothetical protein
MPAYSVKQTRYRPPDIGTLKPFTSPTFTGGIRKRCSGNSRRTAQKCCENPHIPAAKLRGMPDCYKIARIAVQVGL